VYLECLDAIWNTVLWKGKKRQAAAMAAIAGGRENEDPELLRKEQEAMLPYL
jgi:hypothetical protein